MYKNKKVGVVVPAYNEAAFISKVINGIPEYVDLIYIVNDASTDYTGEIASGVASNNKRVRLITHEQNYGVGKAIISGYKGCLESNLDIVAIMAGDNQMDPVQLPLLLDPLVSGEADYTVGDRISNLKHMKGMSLWRRLGNWILRWLTRIAAGNFNITDPQNGYTAITRQALLRLDLDEIYPRYGYCNDILVRLSIARARIKQIPMPAVYGSEKSKIRYPKYIPTVSWLLLKSFLRRMKIQLFQKNYYTATEANSDVR
jgi:glycosyltransferase involved in cell wall biosynthesis